MANLKFEKVDGSLPAVLTANTMYMVQVGNVVKLYITNSAGTKAVPVVGNTPEVEPFLLMGVLSG